MLRVCTAIFLVTVGMAWADGGPALTAIKTAQSVASAGSLVEVTGQRGQPRPPDWTILYSDPQARGGIREVVVSADVIVSQRTPLSGYAGVASEPVIKLPLVNYDSDAAFKIAEQQARNKHIGFEWVDYSLKSNDDGAPVWTLNLIDHMGAHVGKIEISAESGVVLKSLQTAETRHDEETSHASDSPAGQKMGGVIGAVDHTVRHTATKVKDTTLRTVGTVQEILTGHRTIGPKDDDDNQ